MNNKMLFMGQGTKSEAKCKYFQKRLEECFGMLSGRQQMGAPRNEEEKEYFKDSEHENEQFIRDVARALTGKKIKFIK